MLEVDKRDVSSLAPDGPLSPPELTSATTPPYRDIVMRFRLALYGLSAPAFVYSTYVQLVLLKSPDRIQLPAATGFGRDTVFLTFQGNIFCTIYSWLCLLHTSLSLRPCLARSTSPHLDSAAMASDSGGDAVRKRIGIKGTSIMAMLERVTHRYSGPLFAVGFFVGTAYYALIHFHPKTRLRALMVEDFDRLMALLHLLPLAFVVADALLKDDDSWRKHHMGSKGDERFIFTYGCFYCVWSYFCVYMNGGNWPYPFQQHLNVIEHVLLVATVLLISMYLTRFANRITGRFDRSSRRRWQARQAGSQIRCQ